MMIQRNTKIGDINVTTGAIASLTGNAVSECYGVVGMASEKFFKDGFAKILKQENYSKGVVVRMGDTGLELDIYIIVCYGVNILSVVCEVQKKVMYELEKAFDIDFAAINVFVQDVKVID